MSVYKSVFQNWSRDILLTDLSDCCISIAYITCVYIILEPRKDIRKIKKLHTIWSVKCHVVNWFAATYQHASRRTRQIEVATCCRLALLSGIIRKLKRDHSMLRLWDEINVFIDCFAPFCKLSHVNFSVCILFTAQSNLTV